MEWGERSGLGVVRYLEEADFFRASRCNSLLNRIFPRTWLITLYWWCFQTFLWGACEVFTCGSGISSSGRRLVVATFWGHRVYMFHHIFEVFVRMKMATVRMTMPMFTLSIWGARRRSEGRWPDRMNWISTWDYKKLGWWWLWWWWWWWWWSRWWELVLHLGQLGWSRW